LAKGVLSVCEDMNRSLKIKVLLLDMKRNGTSGNRQKKPSPSEKKNL